MLDRYAQTLITHAVSLVPGQDIFIRGTEYQREFGLLLGEKAYKHGARSVHYHFPNIKELKQLIVHGSFEQISLYQRQVQAYLSEIYKHGTLRASKPFRLFNLSQVRDLEMIFQEGRVVEFSASQGEEAFGEWIDTDRGARFLGEIGLVGSDSPIYNTDLYFDLPNIDENASSHIALGNGVGFAYADSERISESELPALGCNQSSIHTDICFDSSDVSIVPARALAVESVRFILCPPKTDWLEKRRDRGR